MRSERTSYGAATTFREKGAIAGASKKVMCASPPPPFQSLTLEEVSVGQAGSSNPGAA